MPYSGSIQYTDSEVGPTLDYVNLRTKRNCKRSRSVTVSDQKGLITRRKEIWAAEPSGG